MRRCVCVAASAESGDAALAETRTRAALAADNPRLAREFAADVPVARTAALLQWSDLLESPKTGADYSGDASALAVEPEALAAGFEKLAHTDSAGALDLLPMLLARAGLTSAMQARLKRAAALGAAYDRDPRAIAAFDDLPAAAVDSQVQEWRVRAALWIGDYDRALEWIEQMPAESRDAASLALLARARMAATAGDDAAAPLFAEIAGLRDYYGYLAADRLHPAYNLNVRPSPDDIADANRDCSRHRADSRARTVRSATWRTRPTSEWTAVLGGAEPAVKVQAAHLAARWGWYPAGHCHPRTSRRIGRCDTALSAALSRRRRRGQQASQASPPTGYWASCARKACSARTRCRARMRAASCKCCRPRPPRSRAAGTCPRPRKDDLFDPSVAVPLGAAYLRELLDRYGGQLDLSLAAYNAGPAAVARWLPPKSMDADVWVENIPYNETRGYVQHIWSTSSLSPRCGAPNCRGSSTDAGRRTGGSRRCDSFSSTTRGMSNEIESSSLPNSLQAACAPASIAAAASPRWRRRIPSWLPPIG